MNNLDLKYDIENIKGIKKSLLKVGQNIAISKAFDNELDFPYAIDVEDTSYFYANSKDRDNDFDKLLEIIKN